MAFTQAQMNALERARKRIAQGGGQADDGLTEEQRKAIAAARERLGSSQPRQQSKDGGSDFVAGVSGGIDSLQGTAYGLVGLAGDALERNIGIGESLRDFGFEGYQRNMAQIDDEFRDAYTFDGATDSVGNFIDAGQYYIGRAAPDALAALVSGGVGAAIAKKAISEGTEAAVKNRAKDLIGDRLADKVTREGLGATAGVFAQSVGQSTGGIYGQAGEEAIAAGGSLEDVDLGRVARYGLAAGSIETAADIATLGLAGYGVGKNLIDIANSGGRVARGAKKGVIGAGVEAVTEGVQTGLEDMGAGKTFSEAAFMDPTSMMAGAFGGGAISGIGGGLSRPNRTGSDLDTAEAIQRAQEEAELQRQADADAEAQAQVAAAAERELKERRLTARDTFISEADFVKERNAKRLENVANRDTEIGAAYHEWRLDNDVIENTDKERKSFLKQYVPQDDAAIAKQEYLTALDEHAMFKQVESERSPEAQAVIDEQKAELTQEYKDAKKAKDNEAMRLVEQKAANTLTAAEWRATKLMADGKIKQAVKEAVEAVTAGTAPVAETPAKVKPPTKRETLTQQAIDQLGETWEQDHPELSQLAADNKSFWSRGKTKDGSTKESKFERALNKIVAEQNAPTTAVEQTQTQTQDADNATVDAAPTPTPPNTTALENLFTEALPSDVKLSPNEKKVFDTLNEAFNNNEQDDVIQADGTLNAQRIADRAGLNSRQAAKTAITRLKPKIAKAYGVDQDAIKKRLAETSIKNVEAFDANNEAVFDKADLADGTSTLASINQGAREGMSQEDIEFMENRSNEPDAFEQKRLEEAQKTRDAFDADLKSQKYYGDARATWDNGYESDIENEADRVPFDSLDVGSRFEWTQRYLEFQSGTFPMDDLDAYYDEIRNEFVQENQANVEADTTEQVAAVESETVAEVAERPSEQVREDGPRPVEAERTPKPGFRSIDDIRAQKERQRKNNVASFRENFNDGFTMKNLRSNPDLADVVEYAEFLGKFTDKQWAKVEPIFNNELNPFKTAGSIDLEDAKSKIVEALRGETQAEQPAKETKKEVVDTDAPYATGKPFSANVYHGSSTDVGDFDAERLGENTGTGSAQEAFFFSGKPETANSYAENRSEQSKADNYERSFQVAKKYLSGKDLNEQEQRILDAMLEQANEDINGRNLVAELEKKAALGKDGYAVTQYARTFAQQLQPQPRPTIQMRRVSLKNPFVYDFKGSKFRDETYVDIIKTAKEKGHDGVVLLNTYDVAGKTADQLTEADQDTIFAVFDTKSITDTFSAPPADNNTVVVTKKKRRKIDPKAAKQSNPRFGLRPNWDQTASRESMEQVVNELTGSSTNMRVHVFDTEADAIAAVEAGDVPSVDVDQIADVQPYGWVQEDSDGVSHAHFILDRIAAGHERATFMHEVGGHIGIDNVLPEADRVEVARQIADWAGKNDGSLESRVARRAMERMDWASARGGVSDNVIVSEAVAYFLEEATLEGVDPTAKGSALSEFVAKIYNAFADALQRLGVTSAAEMTAQDVVDMAYGAARLELVESMQDPTTDNSPMTSASMGVARRQNEQGARYGVRDWAKKNMGDTAAQFIDDSSFIAKNAAASTKFLHQFIRDVKQSMPSASRWYNAMLEAEKTRNDIRRTVEDIALQARDLTEDRLDAVNDFIGKSTFYQKWGYDPRIANKKVKVDPTMKAAFQRLSAEEQQLVKNVFQHGENMRQRKKAIAKAMGVSGKFFNDSALEGPYAPLKRFGNFAGELKSQKLLDAEKELANRDSVINKKKVADLKSDPDHYVISFFDTMGAAKQFTESNASKYAQTQASERAPDIESDRISNPEVFEKILGAVKADSKSGMDASTKAAFSDMVKKMYFQSLDERDARLSGARRLNRAGYEKNMIRSFLSHARAEAALVANMEHGAEINTAFKEAANQAATNREELQSVYNMIAKHYGDTLNGKETPIQDRLAAMNSVYMLTTSVGYHVTNATQPIMVTVPKLAGDFKDYSGAWGALIRGYKVSLAATSMDKNMQANIDIDKAPPKYRKLLQELELRQLLDVGMEEDLSNFDRFNTGYEPLNQLSDKLGKVVHKLYQVARYVEAHNRISAAVAAYDMATANPGVARRLNMTNAEYATAIVEDTQGNFSRFDAPYAIKALPKLTTQYRKYQLMMAWTYANSFNAAFRDKSISAEEKAMGRRTLGYLLGHAGLFAGATGVPLLSTVAPYALAFMGDEDEPQDLERWIRDNVEDERLADVLTRGLPAMLGIDMSTKLSQAKIFHPLPYAELEASEEGIKNIFFQAVSGPAGTTFLNFGRSAEYFSQGDMMKGIEYAVPKGLRTLIESYRLGTEGYTMKNGDVIVDPRNIDVTSLLVNAIGIPSTEINKIKWTRGQQYELEQYFSKEQSRIRRQYIEAYNDRDFARTKELKQEWRELQDGKDRVRPMFGNSRYVLKRQSTTDLMRAPREQRRRERKAQRRFSNVNE